MKTILISLCIIMYGMQTKAQTCVSDSFDRAYRALHRAQKDFVTNWEHYSQYRHDLEEEKVSPKVAKLKADDSTQIMTLYRNLIGATTTYVEFIIVTGNNFLWSGVPFDTISPKMKQLQKQAKEFVAREVKLEPLMVLSKSRSKSLVTVSLNHQIQMYSIDEKILLYIYFSTGFNYNKLNDPICTELLKQVRASKCMYANMLLADY